MRRTTINYCISLLVLAAAAAAGPAVDPTILGCWRSEDIGLDFPQWMVDTYSADGSVQTDFFAQRPGKQVVHGKQVLHMRWRISNNAVEIGKVEESNSFHREGLPRPIKKDANGKVISIGEWTRVDPATNAALSQPSDRK